MTAVDACGHRSGPGFGTCPGRCTLVLAVALGGCALAWVAYAGAGAGELRRPVHLPPAGPARRGRARIRAVVLDRAHRVPSTAVSRVARRSRVGGEARRARSPRTAAHRARCRPLLGTASVALVYAITARAVRPARRARRRRDHRAVPEPRLLHRAAVLGDALPVRRAARGLADRARRLGSRAGASASGRLRSRRRAQLAGAAVRDARR